MTELAIRNANIVDGTGRPAFRGDLTVADGKIESVGGTSGPAARTIDAQGLTLSPGFIDIHTHFDPQLCWDRLATPSIEHGVTTVVIGNCSLSLAPVRPSGVRKLVLMFQVIEDIKEPTFDAAVPFSWESFPEYLDHIRGDLGINVGALIGHSALRAFVLREEAQARTATDTEISEMCAIVEEAMAAGALGLSSSYVDVDEKMQPVPSRYADLREKVALCEAVRKSGRGVFQVVPNFLERERQLENIAELSEISRRTGILCSLQPVLASPTTPEVIAALEAERARGARIYGQVMPRNFDLNMRLSETSMLLFGLPRWKEVMDAPVSERIAAFRDPTHREALVNDMEKPSSMSASVPFLRVAKVKSGENEKYVGQRLREIGKAEGKPVAEVLMDIALADDLETEFQMKGVLNADKEAVAALMDHDLLHVGASDAGAHIAQFCGTGDTTHLLEHFVRETGKMTLERAIHRITGELAGDWGLADRGTLEVGKAADLVLFDPETVACTEEVFVDDFPGEANRYVRRARGYETVVVNGEVVYENGRYTSARPGAIV